MTLFFSFCLPSRKAGGLQIPVFHGICDPRSQAIAVANYSFTLDALLERSGNPACGGSEALQLLQRWGLYEADGGTTDPLRELTEKNYLYPHSHSRFV